MMLDIGSGEKPMEGYTTLDNYKNADIKHDLHKLPLPIQSDSLEVINFSHILEHFVYTHGLELLKECHRILSKGGRIDVYVPNLTNCALVLLGAKVLRAKMSPEMGNLYGKGFMYEDREQYNQFHKHGYISSSLREILKRAGFQEIMIIGSSKSRRQKGDFEYARFNLGWFASLISAPELHGVGYK